jgi:hypothetical protein
MLEILLLITHRCGIKDSSRIRAMSKYTLILIHRGSEYDRDFREIGQNVMDLDSSIKAYCGSAGTKSPFPHSGWENRTLVVALNQSFALQIKRGTVLKNRPMSKLTQAKIFRDAGIPTPPMLPFKIGMKLDPILFGEFVIIKPMSLGLTSKGKGIQLFRRRRLEQLRPIDFSTDHLIWSDREGYLVQKFIRTGNFPSTYRVLTFMGEVLYAMKYQSLEASPDLNQSDTVIEAGNVTQKGQREFQLGEYAEKVTFAKRIANAFDSVPLLGIDIIAEEKSDKLYALEVNAGGNTWHFSSKMWEVRRKLYPKLARQMKEQYSAFDAAARALVEKTRQLAS